MEQLFGVGDVHGVLWVNERRGGINRQLDPEKFPAMLGRYHFTLAYEAGHWRLHRQLFQCKTNQLSLLPNDAGRTEYTGRVVKLQFFALAGDGRIGERWGAFVFQG